MISRGLVRPLLCGFLIGGLPFTTMGEGRAAAQSQSAGTAFETATEGLKVGTQLLVVTVDHTRRTGGFLGTDERGLLLAENLMGVSVIPPRDIAELSYRRRAWRRGLLIGAAVGAVIGGMFGAGNADGVWERAGLAALGAFTVGVPFGGLGALSGFPFHEWHRTYP